MGPTKNIGILGYSTEEKVYTYYGVDNSNMTMASVQLQDGYAGARWEVDADDGEQEHEGTVGG